MKDKYVDHSIAILEIARLAATLPVNQGDAYLSIVSEPLDPRAVDLLVSLGGTKRSRPWSHDPTQRIVAADLHIDGFHVAAQYTEPVE